MERDASVVADRFPSLRDEIEACFEASSEFRALCQDLAAANEALAHWRGLDSREAIARTEEYRHLIVSLEADVLSLIAGRRQAPPKAS